MALIIPLLKHTPVPRSVAYLVTTGANFTGGSHPNHPQLMALSKLALKVKKTKVIVKQTALPKK